MTLYKYYNFILFKLIHEYPVTDDIMPIERRKEQGLFQISIIF